MRLLFDQNLSYKLVDILSDVFPHAAAVSMLGLDAASDSEIANYAVKNGYVVVSKDIDFHGFANEDFGLKLVHLRLGNVPTSTIEAHMRSSMAEIMRLQDSDTFLIVISPQAQLS